MTCAKIFQGVLSKILSTTNFHCPITLTLGKLFTLWRVFSRILYLNSIRPRAKPIEACYFFIDFIGNCCWVVISCLKIYFGKRVELFETN